MPLGPGKYDDMTTHVRDQTKAAGVAVIIIGGSKGDGLSVQAPLSVALKLPAMLRFMADEIEKSGPL